MKDRALGATIRIQFTTHTFATGVVVAPSSAFVAADFRIYKDGSSSEKTSANGITVTSPWDSLVGTHLIEIDTSNSTGDVGFWTSGSAYRVVIVTAKTVDSKDPSNVCVGEFSLELQTADVRKIGGDAQSAIDLKDFADAGYDPAANKVLGVVLVDTTTTNTDMRGTDNAALAATALSTATWTGTLATNIGTTNTTVATNLDATVSSRLAAVSYTAPANSDIAAILVDTNELQADWVNGGRLDLILDARATQTSVDAIQSDTNDIQTRLPAALEGGRMAAALDSAGRLAIWNTLTTGTFTADSFGELLIISDGTNGREVKVTASGHMAADVHDVQPDGLSGSTEIIAINTAAVTTIPASLLIINDGVGYLTSALLGTISDAGTAGETYVVTFGGATYTLDYTGLDATGNRTGVTRTKT